jgi:PAS domain S-box-containing protein
MTVDSGRAMEDRLRAVVESAPSGLLVTDANGIIVLVNREVERLFGYTRDELLGRSIELLVPHRIRGAHVTYRAGLMSHPEKRAMGAGRDIFGARKDGTEIPVEIGLTPVTSAEGTFVISSIVDISERKRAESEQRKLAGQLLQAQKLEAVGTLAGGIAHDFNNILSAIVGLAELARPRAPRPVAEDLEEILKSAERGKQLVERLLSFCRRKEPEFRPLDLAQVTADAMKLLRATIPAPVELTQRIESSSLRIIADATSVHQVLMNLVTNAAHASPNGGRVEVSAAPIYVHDSLARSNSDLREGEYAVLAVADEGTGIDPAVLPRVFEPFFTTKPAGLGSGLGLAMVRGIMRDHGGAIELQSTTGVGTTVRCFFPITTDATAAEAPAEAGLERGLGERILYVDDETALARIGERRLLELGYEVTSLTESHAALSAFERDPWAFDLVITDLLMPGLTGIDLAREIHRLRGTIPILLLTGFLDEIRSAEVAAAGIRNVLRKPVTAAELARAVRGLLDRRG